MATINWSEHKPRGSDQLKELASVVRSQKTAIRAALEEAFYWNDSQDSAGQLRVSTTTPGSARAFYGPRSEVSHPGRDGTFHFVSDESRLLVYADSTQSVALGSLSVMVFQDSDVAAVDEAKIVVDSGTASLGAESDNNVTFNVTYSIAPDVLVTPSSSNAASAASYSVGVHRVNASGMSIYNRYIGPGADPSACNILWRSIGTVDTL